MAHAVVARYGRGFEEMRTNGASWCVRYADGGGLTAAGRRRRETVRIQAAELFEKEIKPPEVARRLRVSGKSAYQWHQLGRDDGV